MKNDSGPVRLVLLAVMIGFLFPLRLTGQTNFKITEGKDFTRITILNGTSTVSSAPVMSSGDKLINGFTPVRSNKENYELTGWTNLQTVSGVVKAISFVSPEVGYMAAELGVVYKTTDGGADWSTVLNLGFPYYWYGVHTFTPQKVLIAGFNNSTGDGIMRWTFDGGTTWTSDIIVAPAPLNWLMGLDFADSLHGLAVGSILSAGIVFITDNGGTDSTDWTPVVADPTQGWFAGNFTMRPDGKYYITGISFCNSTDFGMSWARRNSIDNVFDGGVSFPDDLHGWTGGGSISPAVEGWVHRTTDGGNTWSGRILNTPYPIRVVYFLDSQTGIALGGEVNSGIGGIWESTDGGTDWTEAVTTGLEMSSIDWQRVSPDSIDIWSVGYTSSGGYHSVVYKKRIGFAIVPVELASFTANVQNGNVMLNWQTSTETNNRGFEIQRSEVGDQRSDITEWEKIGYVEGYGTTTDPKQYTYTDKYLTSGKYSYRLKQIDFNGSFEYSKTVEVEIDQPEHFSLSQNYPNPFNPATTIGYQLPVKSTVTLKVFDVLGNEITTLINEEKPAGTYKLAWNAENLPSGVYYYQLRAGTYIETRKMMLLK